MFFQFPYTDLYSLNLDWLIKAMKEVQDKIEQDRGERVLSFNTRTGTVTLQAADVNALGINSVSVVPSISDLSPDAISAAYESGVRILLEGSAGTYTKAGFMVAADEGIDICMLSVDMSPIQEQIDAIQDKVNPETAAAGNVFTIDAQGNSVWAPPTGGNADLSTVAPVYTNTHPAIESIGFYFYYDNALRVSTRAIAENAAITDNNSRIISRGGLNDININLENEISEIDNKLNPEAPTEGNVLTINSAGESEWLPGPNTTELTRKVNDLNNKVNPVSATTGNVLKIDSEGKSVWGEVPGGASGSVNITVTPDASGNYTPSGTIGITGGTSLTGVSSITANTPTAVDLTYNAATENIAITVTNGRALTYNTHTIKTIDNALATFTGTPVAIAGTIA